MMQTDINREILTAFLDGELPPTEMARIAALLATRPELDAWVRRQGTLQANLREAFADVTAMPPPERLVRTVHETSPSWRWRMQLWRQTLTVRALLPAGAALAVGLVAGMMLQPTREVTVNDGQVVAAGALSEALDSKLASTGYDSAGPRIGISFRNRDGHDCRTFSTNGQAGLACHQPNGWVIAMLVGQPQEQAGAYRMAGSEMPDAIRDAVTASIQGSPFDAAAEKAARDRGWK
jgi:hypothetical protein